MDPKFVIAKRVSKELKNGQLVNLGIGIPTLVVDYIPKDVKVLFQSENGIIGMSPLTEEGLEHPDLTNAGANYVSAIPGAACFDSALSFGIIRGGHLDLTVLGGLQVDEEGHLANWMVPGRIIPGMGGAMDLVTGAKRVIVAMTHTSKGEPKIVKKCTLPLTSVRRVDLVVTEMAVIEPTDNGLVLREISPEVTLEEVLKATQASLIISDELKVMEL